MLNISKHSVAKAMERYRAQSANLIYQAPHTGSAARWLVILLVGFALFTLLPWTQNIRGNGQVINLKPENRPQVVNSVIAGRIERWYVQEGQFVHKGDTILFISEVKDEYFDPQLLDRTRERIAAQEGGVEAYLKKLGALDNQYRAIEEAKRLKISQAGNKVRQAALKVATDSLEWQAARTNLGIAETQLNRQKELQEKGLKSLNDVENATLKWQEAQAKAMAAENKLLTARNEMVNAKIELSTVAADYNDKMAKNEGEQYTALSQMMDAEATLAKSLNELGNYTMRSSMYFITAPQDGYITNALQSGIGETIKEGEAVVSIVPSLTDVAVEVYLQPMSLPLVAPGTQVRLVFDGWPTLVFSGWPNTGVGTFAGTVMAVDNVAQPDGNFRMIVVPDSTTAAWPSAIRVGTGVKAIALLKEVPIWYELWRLLNGFPPEFYQVDKEK